jgi:sugar/nucleoside kinase (ribokinase family)
MSNHTYDLLALGNAIVDVIARAEEDFLAREDIHKGAMILIDEPRALHLNGAMGESVVQSGGSAANTIAGAASLGIKTAYIGKVKADDMGAAFRRDIEALGAKFPTASAADGPATARCFIIVTPDGERTMNTYLGACQNLTTADVDKATVEGSAIVYLEGYLWDPPAAKEAFVKASNIAHAAGRRVALTLSDSFCVDRYRGEFLDLMRNGIVDILFANQHELISLYQTADFDTAVAALREEGVLGVVTRSEQGSMVVTRESVVKVPAFPIKELVDTTGAGDLYASGFLAGLAQGRGHADCARLGALAAAEVIQHIGARPQVSLAALAKAQGL